MERSVKPMSNQGIKGYLSDKTLWIYFIVILALALILIFTWMYKSKTEDYYEGLVLPTWTPNKYLVIFIYMIVGILYFLGSFIGLTHLKGSENKTNRIIHQVLYFGVLVSTFITIWLVVFNKKPATAFIVSFLPAILLAIQLFFLWKLKSKIAFGMCVPQFILSIVSIFWFYKLKTLSA